MSRFVLLCLLLLLTPAWAAHRPSLAWMARYSNHLGIGCCTERDCVPAAVAILDLTSDPVEVMVNGVILVLPRQSVHHSEDGQAYYCSGAPQAPPTAATVRCVFWTEGA